MNLIDFTKNGGYRFKQFTLRKMQEAYIQILKVFIAFCNVPETGNYIISGCTISGANITDGWLYINGELCKFSQSAGDLTTLIQKNVVIQALGFKNGNNENVFRFVNAQTDPTTGAALSTFIRVSPVFDANYIHTDVNFTLALWAKLMAIEDLAEVNVIPSFTQNDPTAPNYIADKPVGQLLTYLRQGTYIHGDFFWSQIVTISFSDIGTGSYKVIGNIVGESTVSNNNDVTINFITREHTSTSFKLVMYDYNDYLRQNVKFQWILTPDITS